MLTSTVVRIVGFCVRRPWPVIIVSMLLGVIAAIVAARNFNINTDVNTLISSELDWRKREIEFEKTFPGPFDTILVVIDAPTSELVSQAATALTDRLKQQPGLFSDVRELGGGAFLARSGLLFLPPDELTRTTKAMGEGGPLISTLASDQSLRGLTRALSLVLAGVQGNRVSLDSIVTVLGSAADAVENVLADRPASFSWRAVLTAGSGRTDANQTRRFIEVRPVLNYAALEPGRRATDAIRQAAADLKLASAYQTKLRLTGPVPIADEEFATVRDGAVVNGLATVVVVLTILWLALRSSRIIVAVFISLFVGLAITAALGLTIVGPLNLISIAFAVLFVGLGVDFGIQFAVRYRAERYETPDLKGALLAAAEKIGAPLTLAAVGVTAGFLSFLPTHYKGVSELGQIAGMGMLVAYLTSITLLPALLAVFNPPGEPEPVGYKSLAPVDRFLENHRIGVLAGTAIVSVAGLPLLYFLTFDFNPINLRSPAVESVATFLDLRNDPNVHANAISIIAPSLQAATKVAAELDKLPEVDRVATLQNLLPDDQGRKLTTIATVARQLGPALNRTTTVAAPTDAQSVAALNSTADMLRRIATNAGETKSSATAKRLADQLTALAQADKGMRDRTEAVFLPPLRLALDDLRTYLQAEPVAQKDIPDDLRRQWLAPNGQARVEVTPKGDPNDNETLRAFARAVQAKYPEAVGTPVSILRSSDFVVTAFIQAGAFALFTIGILLWIVLGRFGDVLLTLVPLVLAGVVTLEVCVLLAMPLNFANIIALPLLLGVGVAFKIYYVMAWRAGQTDLLQSSLTRAVIWSALTTATAFGSLWLSNHPGTSSMGKLMALSLVCTMAAAVLFQPVLMGKPRSEEERLADDSNL